MGLGDFSFKIYPTLTLPLQRGGSKISSFPRELKGVKPDLCLGAGRFFTRNDVKLLSYIIHLSNHLPIYARIDRSSY